MGEFSLSHIFILTLILLIFFGPSRLPALGQSIGKAIKGFKQGLNEIDTDAKDVGPSQQLNQNQQGVNQQQQNQSAQNTTPGSSGTNNNH